MQKLAPSHRHTLLLGKIGILNTFKDLKSYMYGIIAEEWN